jgi:hypothetical protein
MTRKEFVATTAGVGSDAEVITASRFPDDGGGVESSSKTITISPPLGTASAGCSRTAREAVASVDASPSSTAATRTGGGDAIDASAEAAVADTSSACSGTGSVLGGWGRGSEEITCALSVRRFRGARMSMLVTACLKKDRR